MRRRWYREVVASFDGTPSPRLKQLMQALTRHLHAFVRETRLTTEEWDAAIRFLTRCGHITDDRRQEFILLSDVLGRLDADHRRQQRGPRGRDRGDRVRAVLRRGLARRSRSAATWRTARPGSRAGWRARSPTPTASPSPGARIEVWEADDGRLLRRPVRRRPHGGPRRTCSATTRAGYAFWGVTPTPYPIPHDGPVGDLLAATGRSPMRASHLHFMVSADGLHTLVTHIFVRGRRVPRPRRRVRRQAVPRQGLRADRTPARPPPTAVRSTGRGRGPASTSSSPPRRGTKDEDVHWIAVHEGHRLT